MFVDSAIRISERRQRLEAHIYQVLQRSLNFFNQLDISKLGKRAMTSSVVILSRFLLLEDDEVHERRAIVM